jgi:SAM-dependent methyltransferase
MTRSVFGGIRRILVRGRRASVRSHLPGQFQPYSFTLPDRYPWLFEFAAATLRDRADLQLLSFGCSRGDEIEALRKHFPHAAIRGLDVNPSNVEECLSRAHLSRDRNVTFAVASSTEDERDAAFDAIFCCAVLCQGDLTASGARRCDPQLRFADFETMVAGFARCLKPGGLLLLHTSNFRFCDTATARDFDTVLQATSAQLADDVLFDRNNLLLPGVRYHDVAFRKKVRIHS